MKNADLAIDRSLGELNQRVTPHSMNSNDSIAHCKMGGFVADTEQGLIWALERKCDFRNGDHWFLPDQTHSQLSDLRVLTDAQADRRIVDGICVTSWTIGRDQSGGYHHVPIDGFVIEDRFGGYGGIEQVNNLCGQCEANVGCNLDTRIAGCFGYLDAFPDSPELDQRLRKIIAERGWNDRLRSTFTVTTPLWYGFWIESPLRQVQAEFLYEILNAERGWLAGHPHRKLHFMNALRAAIKWELPLHVSLPPLGHTDLGWYTVFPHCPRCKANAPVGRWQEEYPSQPHKCKVCGHVFIPNEHHSMERYEFDSSTSSLQDQLGDGLYEFIANFLQLRGCTDRQIEEVIDNEKDGPLLRQISSIRQRRNATLENLRKSRLIQEVPKELPRLLNIALNDDVELELVLIPAGEFLMGTDDSDEQSDQLGQHIVKISRPFYIGRFPVTQAQWKAVRGGKEVAEDASNLPVSDVSWFDCQEFCEDLCQRHGRVFRLPSEAEWEYACRAGTTTRYAFGDSLSVDQANFTPFRSGLGPLPSSEHEAVRQIEEDIEQDVSHRLRRQSQPTAVGNYPPNLWGIYDMHGNVNEWCEDAWHDNYEDAPSDGTAWITGGSQQAFRVMRGGWHASTEFVCTSAKRLQYRADAGNRIGPQPDDGGEDEESLVALYLLGHFPCGFRIVCEV